MPKDYQYVPLPPEFRTTRPVGPVRDQRSEAERLEALLATRDRLAQQTPRERLIAGMDPTLAGPRRSAAPTVTLASLSAAPTPRANVGTMLDLLQKNPEATQADLAELEAATQPRRPPVIRASTLSERLRDKYYDLFESAARQPIGRLADAFGLSDLQGIANERATGGKLVMATAVPPPGAGTLATVAKEAQAARALTGGFYSRVDEAAKFLPSKGVKAESLINTLKKASGGVSAEELELRGLAEFAASKRGQVVTPADLAAHLKANPAPFPTVKTLGGNSADAQARYNRLIELGNPEFDARRIVDETYSEPKFSKYQVPGGKNYRETLLTLPDNPAQQAINIEAALAKAKDYDDVPAVTLLRRLQANESGGGIINRLNNARQPGGRYRLPEGDAGQFMPFEAVDRTRQLLGGIDEMRASEGFRSSHFPDDPNIVAHTRSNERTSPTGERGTFLEEVQSDWHQAGKERGYTQPVRPLTKTEQAEFDELHKLFVDIGPNNYPLEKLARYKALTDISVVPPRSNAVPDAPFKENWPDLSLKQALIDEANRSPDPGFLGFTGGKTQAARYDLSKQVKQITAERVSGDRFILSAEDHGGNTIFNNRHTGSISADEMRNTIGKEMADKVMQQPERGTHVYNGLNLQVGGEGMHEFYDKLLPKRLEKIVKPFGGSVERGEILGAKGVNEYGMPNKYPQPEPAWLSRLTPEMKARILKEGLPLMGLSGLTLGSLLGAEKQQAR